jgi:hypothetical protein
VRNRAATAISLLMLLGAVGGADAQEEEREPPPPETEQEEEQEVEPVLGRSSAGLFQQPQAVAPAETFDLSRGSRLRLSPDLGAPLVEIVAEPETAAILERHEDWVRVRYGIWKAWVLESGPDTGLVFSAAPIDRQESLVSLERVRELMGAAARETALGPYRLLTDVREGTRIEGLGPLVESLVESYRERFGVDPGPPRGEVIVIFRREGDYRQFERDELHLGGVDTEGYTGEAVVGESPSGAPEVASFTVTYVGERELEPLREVLVHELTHVLNRRAVGAYLPAWLEEGLAEDLALSRVDGAGRLILGSWGGSTDIDTYSWSRGSEAITTTFTGSRAALQALLISWRTPYRPELEQLTRLSWEMLITPASRALLYAQSAFLTRYLIDGAGGASAEIFRAYLADVAAGDLPSDALWGRLDRRPEAFEEDFYVWLRARATAYGVAVPR